MNAREVALNVLYKIEIGEAYSNLVLDKELKKADLSNEDKALASQIVYGVLTWKLTLDEIVKKHSTLKLKKISPWIINILRMGIYQICYLDKIPKSAAVNESVNLAKKYGHPSSAKFVNAILRKIEKNEESLLLEFIKEKGYTNEEIISVMTSHPLWMVHKLIEEYGENFALDLMNANNKSPDVTIRVNTLRTTREELLKLFQLKKLEAREGELPDSVIVKRIKTFDEKLYVVQDEAAQLACLKLDPQKDELILDCCSSPGGKTSYISMLMKDTGRVDAWDIHEHRVELVKELAETLGIHNIKASQNDATIYQSHLRERYDRVLLDVPCSGLGVIRKKPDIKWTRKEEDLNELMDIQRKILENVAMYLKVGGTMVYSTCTVLKEENELQIKDFLDTHKNFELMEQIKLFPNSSNTDGFYIAKLHKIS